MAKNKDPKTEAVEFIFYGILGIAGGIGGYFWFASLEKEGSSFRTNALLVATYELLGKEGVLGVFGGLGLILVIVGIRGLRKLKNQAPAPVDDMEENPVQE